MTSALIQRLCLLLEEIRHKETRYHGSWRKVLNCTFAFTYLPLLSMEVSQINERENKNVADGLAWSYYFGYLKLVLPVLEDQISKSEDYRFKITKKKLFILLPKSCYTYETIDKADPRVISDGNLPAYERNRGGILKRVYRHTVHRVEMPLPDGDVEEPYYIILEYATPLMTLYDMSRNAEAGLSREQRDEQVVLFIQKLKEILDSCEECKGKYELVPISGELGQIADVLVQKLRDADVRELSVVEVSQINERENKNVADGLAWSYYFGYLKLVLPVLEDQISKSDKYRFKITKKKLFILLPKSCYTYKTIDKADPRVISDGNLPASERNRGGILKRVYMHTVHRVEMPLPDGDVEEPYYIILEYATPLMTLYDMSRNAEAGLSREQRDKQVVLFTRKLKEILDSCEECKGKYELVPISGELGQIADVLVQKLRDADVQVDPGSHAE
ncbi:stimulator of interferon genes protein 2-like [Montipora foliosa]|uniref:stimulator of interferon genes protein 2-like n=1 Tax=Montipora foliosa TaxID=591990 RepID=UPI0035F1E91B